MIDESWIKTATCGCQAGPEWCRFDDTFVTQYGRRPAANSPCKFFNWPKLRRAVGMSVQASQKSAGEMAQLVAPGSVSDANLASACVRYSTVGTLRMAGFVVLHTPGGVLDSVHCTVCWAEDTGESRKLIDWTSTASARFDACFDESD